MDYMIVVRIDTSTLLTFAKGLAARSTANKILFTEEVEQNRYADQTMHVSIHPW